MRPRPRWGWRGAEAMAAISHVTDESSSNNYDSRFNKYVHWEVGGVAVHRTLSWAVAGC